MATWYWRVHKDLPHTGFCAGILAAGDMVTAKVAAALQITALLGGS